MALSKNSKIAIVNGTLFYKNKFVSGNILITGKKIKKIILGYIYLDKLKEYKIIDAKDCYVSYGFIDPHVHFRCPGQEYKEDWQSGSKAAIKGGYTFVIDMPNNNPSAINVKTLVNKNKIAKDTPIHYGFYIGLTDNNAKKVKKIYNTLKQKKIPIFGIKVFLGSSTGDLLVSKRRSIFQSLNTPMINLFNCEDQPVLNKYNSLKYNSIFDHNNKRPPEAEVSGIKKIIKASKQIKNKAKIYICHVTSEKEIKIIKKYRKIGFNIIAEITPHHLFFDLSNIKKSNIYKVNPPIRPARDVNEIRKQFNKGFFQIIGTDHAPHLKKEKESPPKEQ